MVAFTFECTNLSLTRNQQLVLHAVNLRVGPNKIVCLLGPSGSGKSSLLRCLNRLTEPPPQTVFVNGADVTQRPILTLRREVGMVFQKAALFPGTVFDNLVYGLALQDKTLSPTEVETLLTQVDLPSTIANQPVDQLSGGQAQRVALARTLATQPKGLLLDEPTSALDPATTRHIEKTILKIREALGLTVLWVTHDVEEAQQVADYVYLLVKGRIADEGEPAHLLRSGSDHLTATFAAGDLVD